jgi:hypothetical protein
MEIEHIIEARPSGRSRQAAWYREMLKAANEQGLSSADLASRAGISLGTIYNWKRRLAEGVPSPQPDDPDAHRLVRVRLSPTPGVNVDEGTFELRLRQGRSVIVPSKFDQRALASLVEVLERC